MSKYELRGCATILAQKAHFRTNCVC